MVPRLVVAGHTSTRRILIRRQFRQLNSRVSQSVQEVIVDRRVVLNIRVVVDFREGKKHRFVLASVGCLILVIGYFRIYLSYCISQ